MFGAFRSSMPSLGGLLWKDPYRLSSSRKSRVRERLRNVDELISTLTSSGVQCGALARAQALTSEANMRPKDKYTTYSPQARGFRKSVHKVPKWTRLTLRENPKGF